MNKKDELILLGARIKSARKARRMSQTDLAFKIGKDQPSINRVEKGNINPSYLYLLEIASGMQITLVELLSDEDARRK